MYTNHVVGLQHHANRMEVWGRILALVLILDFQNECKNKSIRAYTGTTLCMDTIHCMDMNISSGHDPLHGHDPFHGQDPLYGQDQLYGHDQFHHT